MSNIKNFRLITGEDVIAKYEVNYDTGNYKLIEPLQISMFPPSGTRTAPSLGFVPFPMASNDKEVNVNVEHIIFMVDPAEDVVQQYKQIFSEILTPTSSIIT